MSRAAKEKVREFIHPKVKGGRRVLLETIADLIPEGQTMTAAQPDWQLATRIGCDERTIRSYRRLLRGLRVIRVVGGGRGRTASYELLALEGAGADPSLPLIGATPRPRPRSATPLTEPTLFDPPIRSYTVGSLILRSAANIGSNIGSFFLRCANVGSFFLRWASNVGSFFLPSRSAVDVDVTRARDVLQPKIRTTTTAPPRSEDRPPALPCRWQGTVHAWCKFRMHVPMTLHRDALRHLARAATETDADLDARQFAIYAEEAAAIGDDVPILDLNELAFWKRVLQARRRRECERAPPLTVRRPLRAPDIVGGTVCPHTPRCDRTEQCIALVLHDGRVARATQSG